MSFISVDHLSKFYKVHQKEPGIAGSLKSFFARKYNEVKAVDDISFDIEEGELIGFIGPNGAGKTTTLKVLSGLLYPTSGQVSVLGFEPWKRQAQFQRQFALVMGQKNQLWWDLPAMESFILNKEIYEIPDEQFKKTIDELTELLEIKNLVKVQVRKLSLGERMKCELVAALLHSPKVLFLDEPTIGLDVISQKKMRDFIREYNLRTKATIILTSHYMDDIRQLCRKVMVIDKGNLVFNGKLEEIITHYADHKMMTVDFQKPVARDELEKLGQLSSYEEQRTSLRVSRLDIPEVATKILSQFPVADLTIQEPPIEDIIRDLFTDKNYRSSNP